MFATHPYIPFENTTTSKTFPQISQGTYSLGNVDTSEATRWTLYFLTFTLFSVYIYLFSTARAKTLQMFYFTAAISYFLLGIQAHYFPFYEFKDYSAYMVATNQHPYCVDPTLGFWCFFFSFSFHAFSDFCILKLFHESNSYCDIWTAMSTCFGIVLACPLLFGKQFEAGAFEIGFLLIFTVYAVCKDQRYKYACLSVILFLLAFGTIKFDDVKKGQAPTEQINFRAIAHLILVIAYPLFLVYRYDEELHLGLGRRCRATENSEITRLQMSRKSTFYLDTNAFEHWNSEKTEISPVSSPTLPTNTGSFLGSHDSKTFE